jgi:hypothetical protein
LIGRFCIDIRVGCIRVIRTAEKKNAHYFKKNSRADEHTVKLTILMLDMDASALMASARFSKSTSRADQSGADQRNVTV